eukprot:Opistho-2@17657
MLTNNAVEVRDESSGSYFKAFLKDFSTSDVLVAYENEWRPRGWVSITAVRAAPLPAVVSPGFPSAHDIVEVQASVDAAVPASWFPAVVLNAKRGVCLVKFANGSEDMVELERIRPAAPSEPVDLSHLVRFEIGLPQPSIVNYCRQEHVHDDFVRVTQLLSASVTDRNSLVVVGDHSAIDRARLLAPVHIRGIIDIARIRPLNPQAQEVREPDSLFEERFVVPQGLIGLVIGKKGANINRARDVTGVDDIVIDDATSSFIVRGKTRSAVEAARAILELSEAVVPIPSQDIGMIIGRGGKNLQEVTERSQVLSIRVLDPPTGAGADVPVSVVITGAKEAVDNAKLLIDFQLKNAQTMNELAGEFDRTSFDRKAPGARGRPIYGDRSDARDDARDARGAYGRQRAPATVERSDDDAAPRDPRRRPNNAGGARSAAAQQAADSAPKAGGGKGAANASAPVNGSAGGRGGQRQPQQAQAQQPQPKGSKGLAQPQSQPKTQQALPPTPKADQAQAPRPKQARAPATAIPATAVPVSSGGNQPAVAKQTQQQPRPKQTQPQQQQAAQAAQAAQNGAENVAEPSRRSRARKSGGASAVAAQATVLTPSSREGAAGAESAASGAVMAADGSAAATGEKKRRGKGRGGRKDGAGADSAAVDGDASGAQTSGDAATAAPASGDTAAVAVAAAKDQRPPRQRRRKEGEGAGAAESKANVDAPAAGAHVAPDATAAAPAVEPAADASA